MNGLAKYTNACTQLTFKTITIIALGLCVWGVAQARDSLENELGMRFVKTPAGTFTMGTTEIEAARREFPEPKPGIAYTVQGFRLVAMPRR